MIVCRILVESKEVWNWTSVKRNTCADKIFASTALLNPSSKNIRYIRLCSLVLTIKHAVRFSTGGKDSHRLISAQFALLAFELFATRARRFFIVAVEKESREQQRRGKEKKKTRRRRRRRGVFLKRRFSLFFARTFTV